MRGENPDITFSEPSKKLAAEWSALPEEEKLKYNEFAKKDKDRLVKIEKFAGMNFKMATSLSADTTKSLLNIKTQISTKPT